MYLNYAALCPTRPEAQREVDATLDEFNAFLYSEAGLRWYEKKVTACRHDVAELLRVSDPSSIAFVPNASMASHLALSFIDWEPGDVILTSTHENPSIVKEMAWLAHRGVNVSTITPTSPEHLLQTMATQCSTQPIRAIMLSHASHVDGRIFPISEIGKMTKQLKVLFLIDGAQAVGHIPVHLDHVDFDLYFFPGHKWCQGPLGTGALVIKDSFVQKNPAFAQAGLGWNRTQAGRCEIGTHHIGLIAGFAKACSLRKEEELKTDEKNTVREYVKQRLAHLGEIQIKEWHGPHAPGILTFQCRTLQHHEVIMHTFQNQSDLVAKQFLDYPDGETPAIRLSWLGEKDRQSLSLAADTIKERFKEA